MKLSFRLKLLTLFFVAFVPRIIGIDKHAIFADEIAWMVRGKETFLAIKARNWVNLKSNIWWMDTKAAEPIGLPMAFFIGGAITFLTPGYSNYSLNITKDYVASRIPAVFLGSLIIPLFYYLLKKNNVKDKVAFTSGLLFAMDPVAIGLSRWAHQDVALMAFTTLGLLSTGKASLISNILAILTKPQGLISPFVLAVTKKSFFWLAVSIVATALLWPYLETQFNVVSTGHLTIFNGEVTTTPPWYYYLTIFPFRIPEGILLGLLLAIFVRKKKLPSSLLVYSAIFLVVISLSDKKLGIRYLFGIWPLVYLLAGYGLQKIKNKFLFWIIALAFPIFGIFKFYPSYYLYHNGFINGKNFQQLESVGFCDGVAPSIKYLEAKLFHGVKIMLPGCDGTINYYTGFTINKINALNENPDYVIIETQDKQKFPLRIPQVNEAGYKEIKKIEFADLELAKIYAKF